MVWHGMIKHGIVFEMRPMVMGKLKEAGRLTYALVLNWPLLGAPVSPSAILGAREVNERLRVAREVRGLVIDWRNIVMKLMGEEWEWE